MKRETVSEFDIGRTVLCDLCSEDFTDSPACGGFLYISKAVCPDCAPRMLALAIEYNEMEYIRARCPDGMTFADWCRELRGGNNSIRVERISD